MSGSNSGYGATSGRIAGISTISINGNYMDVKDLSYCTSSIKRETISGLSGVAGFNEMRIAGYITFTAFDNSQYDTTYFNSSIPFNVEAQTPSGKSIIGTGMWQTDGLVVNPAEGTFEIKFESDNIVTVTP